MNEPTLAHIMANAVADRLTKYKGNRTHTARSLGINLRTLRNWLSPLYKVKKESALIMKKRLEEAETLH